MTNNNQRLTKEELKRTQLEDSLKGGIIDGMTQRKVIKTEKGTMLNNLLLGRRKQTLSMYKVPVASFSRTKKNGPFRKKLEFIKLAESRLTRFFESNIVVEDKTKVIPLNNGELVEAKAEYTYSELVNNPIIFVEFVGKPFFEDSFHLEAYEECKKIIKEGLTWKYKDETIVTEYAQSSASEMRTLKGMFVRKDFRFSDEYLSKFSPISDSDEDKASFESLMETMRGLRGAEVIYTAMSYGAYLKDYAGREDIPAKFMSRMGMSQTSTKSLGNDFKVKCIGEIKFPWTKETEEEHSIMYSCLMDEDENRLFSDEQVEKIVQKTKKFWKEEKVDGQNIIRDSAVIRGFRRLGIRLRPENVLGKLVQFRWAGVKGTALVVPDSWFGMPTLPDGTHPYADYDLVIETSSWKYSPWLEYWKGDLSPELELVAMSKQKCTNNMNYQFILALDGDGNQKIDTNVKLKELVDRRYDYAIEAMTKPEIAKAALGVKSFGENDLDDVLDIDEYERTLNTILAKALDACDDIIYDRSWRAKFVNRMIRMRDKMSYGKIPVEGANRFVISDPTAFFRTDLAVPRIKNGKTELDYEGNPMFDIIITSSEQMALRNITSAYWNDESREAVLFRSPCVHPGEPQRVQLVPIDTIPDKIETSYAQLYVRDLFSSIKDIVIVNCFSFVLDAMGGANQ